MIPKNAAQGRVFTFTVPPPLPPNGTATLTYPKEFKELEEHEQKIVENIFERVRRGEAFPVVAGGFGDIQNCDGIVEPPIIEPPEGGRLTKFFGCDFYFKGFPEQGIVEGLGLAKSMMSQLPRQLITKSYFWSFVLGIRLLFSRKRLIHDIKIWFATIYWHTLGKANFPKPKYNSVTKEMKRAGDESLKRMLDKLGEKGDLPYHWAYFPLLWHREWDVLSKRELWEAVAPMLEFSYFFIEHDNAYRFRLQDVFCLLNKENVKKNVRKEVTRLMDILIERENPENGIRYKWLGIRKMLVPAMYVSKDLRNFLKEFLLELDIEKMKPDEHDHYFMLRRDTYRFGGRSTEERMNEADKIDIERKHTRIQLRMLNETTTGKQIPVVQILQPRKT